MPARAGWASGRDRVASWPCRASRQAAARRQTGGGRGRRPPSSSSLVALRDRLPGAEALASRTARGRPACAGRVRAATALSSASARPASPPRSRGGQQASTCRRGRSRSRTRRRCRSPSSANLHYGDRDSVGVFQQRPSRGLGHHAADRGPGLRDRAGSSRRWPPCPRYLRMPIYAAAQAVQHSADGSAYGQYAGMGTELAPRVHRQPSRTRSGAPTARRSARPGSPPRHAP